MKLLPLLLVLVASPVFAQAPDWTPLAAQLPKSVPRVEIQRGEQAGVCSAVVVADDSDGFLLALTAAHCVERAENERLDVTVNGRNAVVVATNSILDLAILRFRKRDEVVIPMADAPPAAGAGVAIAGYSFGLDDLLVQYGHVALGYSTQLKATLIDGMIIFGQSGGPVVDGQGRLVGINSRIYTGGFNGQAAHIAAIVPIDSARDFLDDFRERTKKRP